SPDLREWDEWLAKAEELASQLPGGSENWSDAVRDQVRAVRVELRGVCPWVGVLPAAHGDDVSRSPKRQARATANGPTPESPPDPPDAPSLSLGASGSGSSGPSIAIPDRWSALLAELNTPAGPRHWADRLPALRAELEGWAKGTPEAGHEAAAEA